MKLWYIVTAVVALLVLGLIASSKFQSEETVVSARYEMLACEGCNHMTVEKSKDGFLNGETIIPQSNTVDIEQLIEATIQQRESLCLRGKLYRFNWNPFGISPGGKRFEVVSMESREVCKAL